MLTAKEKSIEKYKNGSSNMFNFLKTFFLCMGAVFIAGYSIFLFLSDNIIIHICQEDGIVETIGAVGFLGAAVFLFLTYRQTKNYYVLFLAFILFVGFAEEISWGQRIFNLQTPEQLKEINIQQEINIHNMKIFEQIDEDSTKRMVIRSLFDVDRLFSIFWFSFCFLIPSLNQISGLLRKNLKRLEFPICSIWIGSLFMFNYALSKFLEWNTRAELKHSLMEVKEAIYAVLFLWVGVYFFKFLRIQMKGNSV